MEQQTTPRTVGRRRITPADVVDVFVFVVVLNLAAQYVPDVIVESFSFSLLTAVLVKVTLDVVLWAEHRLSRRAKAATSLAGKAAGRVALLLVLVGSKFVVLLLEDLLFGNKVNLGGFFAVTGLLIVLTLCRFGVRWLLDADR